MYFSPSSRNGSLIDAPLRSYELSKRPELQARLRDELRSCFTTTEWPTFKSLETLPLFNAFLKETLRRWPTLPGPLEREIGADGAMICDFYLPQGTEVTMQAYTLHRDPSVFPEPLNFYPERWLKETPEMRNAFSTFSHGARGCAGQK